MILAVDASSVTAAAALCSGDGAVVRSDFLHNGLTHSETLLPMIRRVADRFDELLDDEMFDDI